MLGAMHRYAKNTIYTYNILISIEFAGSLELFTGKVVILRENRKGKMKKKADYLSEDEEEAM